MSWATGFLGNVSRPTRRRRVAGRRNSLCAVDQPREDAAHVKHGDECVVPFADARDELRFPAQTDARRALERGGGEFGDLVDLVGANADRRGIAVDLHFDHHDAGIAACVLGRHAEDQAQVRQRHDAAAHVDQSIDRVIGARHRGDRHRVEDFMHMPRLDGETLALQLEDQHNERMVVDACHVGHSAACLVSSCCLPCSTRCATSRISATVPSPRMVAPENAATSACSLDSDLMTVW